MGRKDKMTHRSLWLVWLASLLLCGSAARAQNDPEAGDDAPVTSESGSSFSAGGQVKAGATSQAHDNEAPSARSSSSSSSLSSSDERPSRSETSGTSDPPSGDDHSDAVGHFGVGFFGVMTIPIMDCGTGAVCMPNTTNDLSAPTIGLRYWLNDSLGLEAAVGLRIASGSNGPIDASQFGFALHGGVPLALAHSRHFVFELVPQLNFGLASGSLEVPGAGGGTSKTVMSGMLIEAGAKIGAEIHFGFIGVPQLSLQGTLGLMVRHESRKADIPVGNGTNTSDQSATVLATGVDGSPWDIFRSAITAIYYFY
jgi:hypothetical protein